MSNRRFERLRAWGWLIRHPIWSYRIRRTVQGLPIMERQCLLLRAGGLRLREIAAITNMNERAAARIIQKSIRRLARETGL